MFLYVIIEALAGVVAGLLLALCIKRAAGVKYGALDKVGMVTNIILAVFYVGFSPFYMFLGMICEANHDGFLGVLGWIVSIIAASAALFCGVGLGGSVALRKKGKSVLSFIAQFAGVGGIGLTFLLYALFVGTLLAPLN
jgi:hypothetical protein